jgi:hypothetical protein
MGLLDGTTQSTYYSGNDFGNYQFVSLDDIITQFQIAYVGEGKIIPKIKRTDVAFHAQRALQELSFDTFKSFKAQEIIVPATLQMILPQDYVNYTKISWVDSAGIKHLLYPMSKTSNPSSVVQDTVAQGSLGVYSPLVSGFNDSLALDYTDITTGLYVTIDSTNNQAVFTAAPQWHKLNWNNVTPVPEVGKTYTLTYTISDVPYTDPALATTVPAIRPVLNDGFGNSVQFQNQSQNGTYTETLTMFETSSTVYANRFWFQTQTTTAFTGNISNIVLVESTDIPLNSESTTWTNYKSGTPSENQDDYIDDTYWPMNGGRYGLDPQHAQANGSFYIDNNSGKIHFSSNISGKTVVLDYISDGLGTDEEMQVHKFAEEAMYKCIVHAIMSTSSFGQQLVPRLTKERFAAVRKAKLRLSNIKLEEITQVLRGKSKQIKH